MSSTRDYPVKVLRAKYLDSTCVLVGEIGGLSAVYSCNPSNVMMGCMAVETEHGSLYLDPEDQVEVLDVH